MFFFLCVHLSVPLQTFRFLCLWLQRSGSKWQRSNSSQTVETNSYSSCGRGLRPLSSHSVVPQITRPLFLPTINPGFSDSSLFLSILCEQAGRFFSRTMAASLSGQELTRDSKDAYNTWVRWIAVPFILCYVFLTVSGLSASLLEDGMDDGHVYISRDTGLKMTTLSPFHKGLIATHMWSGIILCLLTLFQKHVVLKMSTAYRSYRDLHGSLGFFILLLSLSMSAAGFLLGFHSALPNFVLFSVLFASPWVCWSLAIWWSATVRRIYFHRLLGNMMLKGCLAVPISRIVGSFLQRHSWGEADGYYQGIILSSILIGTWQLHDCYELWTRLSIPDEPS